jgi:UDP-glucose 4-epimerase
MSLYNNRKRILVTGGAGYIGSHACVELLQAGHDIVVVDNLSNSSEDALQRVRHITGRDFPFVNLDLRDRTALKEVFRTHAIDAVIHFAGLKDVGKSVEAPLAYYDNNVGGSLVLFEVMREAGVKTLVFSSSAAVYGEPASVPVHEDSPLSPTSPYGRTKLIIEDLLRDLSASDPDWRVALLRYFNPVGAHPSGLIGENPLGTPSNLMPCIAQAAAGLRTLDIYGNDYPTPDGTGIRDYIHVTDLAHGHIKALDKLHEAPGVLTWNLGTGRGYSVLEIVHAFEAASGKHVPCRIMPRRPGDIAACYADPDKARHDLVWQTEKGLEEMCADTWRWQSMNPQGYK